MKRVAEQVRDDANPEDIVANWLLVLNEALGSQDIDRLKEIFRPDSYWRDIAGLQGGRSRSEEHTSELQSLMRISYAVFCLKKKKNTKYKTKTHKITHSNNTEQQHNNTNTIKIITQISILQR